MSKVPYMIVVHTQQKLPGKNNKEWQTLEKVYFKDNLSTKMLQEASVVIDLLNNKCVKTRNNTQDIQQLIDDYLGKYDSKVSEALQAFFLKNPSKFQEFINNPR